MFDADLQLKAQLNKDNKLIKQSDIKVTRIKRYLVTVIVGCKDKPLASALKKKLACGGSIVDMNLRLQGDQKAKCIQILRQWDLLETEY